MVLGSDLEKGTYHKNVCWQTAAVTHEMLVMEIFPARK